MPHAATTSSPPGLQAVLFDMDGVVTDTAEAHAEAWKILFDEYLQEHARRHGEPFRPFDIGEDYRVYVDGKPRYDGVKDFLASRNIHPPFGSPSDPPEVETVCGLGNRKNQHFNRWLEDNRAHSFPSTVALIRSLHAAGIKAGIFSSSKNAGPVLRSAGVLELFEVKVDGVDMADLGLPGKPDPAIMHAAAGRLGVEAGRTAIVEDALSGVEAGSRGGFAFVIGIDRGDYGDELKAAGAHVVVKDLEEVTLDAEGRLTVTHGG